MGGAIAIWGFELKDDVAGRGTAQAFVAQGGARDVAAQLFEFLPLVGAARGLRMQTEPLRTHTPPGLWHFWARQAQRRVFPGQHFLASSWPEGNAVGAGGGVQWCQGRIGIGVGDTGSRCLLP